MRPLALAAMIAWPCGWGQTVPPYPSQRVPRGAYTRGSDAPDAFVAAGTQRIDVPWSFQAGEIELTQAHVQALLGRNPSADDTTWAEDQAPRPCREGGVGPTLPATCLSWHDAIAVANALSDHDGLPRAYRTGTHVEWDHASPGWRLPTEREWQWLAFGDDAAGWDARVASGDVCGLANVRDKSADRVMPPRDDPPFHCDDGQPTLAPGRQYPPNLHGLYDTSGNVWEWTWDGYGAWPEQPLWVPHGVSDATQRVARGGSWNSTIEHTRAEARIHGDPRTKGRRLGVRLVRGPVHPHPGIEF